MTISRFHAPLLVATLAAALLCGCGGGGGSDTSSDPPVGTPGSPEQPAPGTPAPGTPAPGTPSPGTPTPADPTPVPPVNPGSQGIPVQPTAVGTVVGAAASATIGPAGGELTSNDGLLTVTIPAGAFDASRQVTIEPISNLAHGAKGPAYRLSPEGLNTPVPMTLTFKADPASLRGTALGALTIATQDSAHRWRAARAPERSAAASTVSVLTHHFSDWALIAGLQLQPATAQVAINETLDLYLIRCPEVDDPESADSVYVDSCDTDVPLYNSVTDWAVNGVAGGSMVSGTVVPDGGTGTNDSPTALFTAPATVPAVNPVAVSVDYHDLVQSAPLLKLVSNVTILPTRDCSWLHGAHTLNFEMEMQYTFTGSGPLGTLSLEQRGLILGEMTQLFDGEQYGTWRGLTTRGSAAVSDQHTFGDQISQLTGSGIPANGSGIDDNQLSAATLVVDYQHCTYAITGQVAVLATGGAGDELRPRNVAGFTRGDLPLDLDTGLVGLEDMPVRLQPDAAGTFFPGGLGIGLVGDGYATEANAGKGKVRWVITR